jgi:hypothetical protein
MRHLVAVGGSGNSDTIGGSKRNRPTSGSRANQPPQPLILWQLAGTTVSGVRPTRTAQVTTIKACGLCCKNLAESRSRFGEIDRLNGQEVQRYMYKQGEMHTCTLMAGRAVLFFLLILLAMNASICLANLQRRCCSEVEKKIEQIEHEISRYEGHESHGRARARSQCFWMSISVRLEDDFGLIEKEMKV